MGLTPKSYEIDLGAKPNVGNGLQGRLRKAREDHDRCSTLMTGLGLEGRDGRGGGGGRGEGGGEATCQKPYNRQKLSHRGDAQGNPMQLVVILF